VRLEAHAEVPTGEGERARELLARAEHACLVSNSLACPVTLVTDVVETGAPLAQAAP
jgi:organic hydroperoxide reductase OsmC/OhrA